AQSTRPTHLHRSPVHRERRSTHPARTALRASPRVAWPKRPARPRQHLPSSGTRDGRSPALLSVFLTLPHRARYLSRSLHTKRRGGMSLRTTIICFIASAALLLNVPAAHAQSAPADSM